MDIALTLVVNPGCETELEKARKDVTAALGVGYSVTTLHEGRAIDVTFAGKSLDQVRTVIKPILEKHPLIDWCLQENNNTRRKSMLIADMDSTMITVECIDELADFVGKKAEVSEITEAAMRGELDFDGALKERVSLLKGLSVDALKTCYTDRIEIMPGARELVRTMTGNGAFAALVSGGFTFFTERVAAEIGFHDTRANILGMEKEMLTGDVAEPICGAEAKLEALEEYCQQKSLTRDQVLAVGDGANDIPMLKAAGLGVAYHAKPKTAAATHAAVRTGDLTTLLYFQGYNIDEFIS